MVKYNYAQKLHCLSQKGEREKKALDYMIRG